MKKERKRIKCKKSKLLLLHDVLFLLPFILFYVLLLNF